jgi:quinoprotein glucose dehydrogenase
LSGLASVKKPTMKRTLVSLMFAVLIAMPKPAVAEANNAARWQHYGGSQHGMQYSSLSQISRENVAELEEVWRFRTGELGEGHREPFAFQANPILVEDRLYLPTGSGIVISANPATGKEIWRYDPRIERNKPHAEIANRGVTSWVDLEAGLDAACRHRIFVGTLDARLIALDGATGEPCEDFGDLGQIWLNKDVRVEEGNWVNYTITSPPVIVGEIVVVGSAIGDNRAVESELGIVRGIDARSGEERWRWDPIPRNADDPAYATWQSDEAARNGSANAWAPLAADVELGLVYVPTGSASPDFFGGEREGDNLYANSVVALHASTSASIGQPVSPSSRSRSERCRKVVLPVSTYPPRNLFLLRHHRSPDIPPLPKMMPGACCFSIRAHVARGLPA